MAAEQQHLLLHDQHRVVERLAEHVYLPACDAVAVQRVPAESLSLERRAHSLCRQCRRCRRRQQRGW
eukprot:2827149-Pleurochrysis_carterae.AAC.1